MPLLYTNFGLYCRHMRTALAAAFLFCAFPLYTLAQAGFPDRPLWLSNNAPKVGDEIYIYTVLYNGTNAKVGGVLTFFAGDAKLSSQEVSLSLQSSSIFSAKWKAVPGKHAFSAQFGNDTASGGQQKTSSVTVEVAEPPPPTQLQASVGKAAVVAEQIASSSAPIVQNVAQAIFAQTEALRNAGAERLEEYLEGPRDPQVAGNSSSATTSSVQGFAAANTASKGDSVLHSVAQTAAAAAHVVFRSVYLFYPIFAILLFSLLAFAYRRLRRPGR